MNRLLPVVLTVLGLAASPALSQTRGAATGGSSATSGPLPALVQLNTQLTTSLSAPLSGASALGAWAGAPAALAPELDHAKLAAFTGRVNALAGTVGFADTALALPVSPSPRLGEGRGEGIILTPADGKLLASTRFSPHPSPLPLRGRGGKMEPGIEVLRVVNGILRDIPLAEIQKMPPEALDRAARAIMDRALSQRSAAAETLAEPTFFDARIAALAGADALLLKPAGEAVPTAEARVPAPAAEAAPKGWRERASGALNTVGEALKPHLRHLGAYVAIMSISGSTLMGVQKMGEGMVSHAPQGALAAASVAAAAPFMGPIGMVLIQGTLILLTAQLFGKLLQRFGQPPVVGEIIGGIVLGPSLLGLFFPGALAMLFPAASLAPLKLLSTLGLLAFMFVVGLEVDRTALKKQASAATLISHASIVVPFLLGSILALSLFGAFAPVGVSFASFSLFMGIAMSITAFPVLARILHDRGLTRTPLGGLALTCAAIDDVSAWGLLAIVIGVARTGSMMAGMNVLLWSLPYIAVMLGVVRPLMNRWMDRPAKSTLEKVLRAAAALAVLAGSAWAAEEAGIHALFGAFLAGAIMPAASGLLEGLGHKMQSWSSRYLLPIFFALTGLKTAIGSLDAAGWLLAAGIIGVATVGKLGASAAAARWSGMSWKRSLSVGALMNTRGLMELVVLNIGYDLGILSANLFTIMVMMALVTTFMTGPLLSWFSKLPERDAEPEPEGRPAAATA